MSTISCGAILRDAEVTKKYHFSVTTAVFLGASLLNGCASGNLGGYLHLKNTLSWAPSGDWDKAMQFSWGKWYVLRSVRARFQ